MPDQPRNATPRRLTPPTASNETARRRARSTAVAVAASQRRPRPKGQRQGAKGLPAEPHREAASKVRSTERALERLAEVEKPFEPWLLHLEMAASPEAVTSWCGSRALRSSVAAAPRADRPRDRMGRRWGSSGETGPVRHAALDDLGTMPLDHGKRWTAPGSCSASSAKLGGALTRASRSYTGFLDASGLETREARSLLAKFTLGAGEVNRAFGTSLRRTHASGAGAAHGQPHQLLRARRADQSSGPSSHRAARGGLATWNGTLLLVTHDRRLLDTVTLTRTLELLTTLLQRRGDRLTYAPT